MTPREIEEYSALRATIRERGTTRAWIALAGFASWTFATLATAALAAPPLATLIPLLLLAAAFEIVFALHVGVERVGRYIQVFFEDETTDPGWESRIMGFAAGPKMGGSDPLFAVYFWIAGLFNLLPALLAGPLPVEWTVIGAGHLLFIFRIVTARQYAAGQRARDLERFRALKEGNRRTS
jgi:hypothetical protein